MRAIRLHQLGPAENLRYEELDDLHPGPGQVRIAVEAAGVHVVDTTLRSGEERGPLAPPELPTIPGREVAGRVGELGAGVDPGWLGRRAVVHLGPVPGGYASQALASAASLHALPDHLDAGAAVAMIGTGRTTMAIAELADLGPGDVALVTAAAGGIGNLLVQIGRNLGALVVGLAGGPEKVLAVRRLGAAIAVDYRRPDWSEGVRERLGFGGRFLMYGWGLGGHPTELSSRDLIDRGLTALGAVGPRVLRLPGGLRGLEERAVALAASGSVTPQVQAFPMAEAAAAHRAIEERRTVGKVVLIP